MDSLGEQDNSKDFLFLLGLILTIVAREVGRAPGTGQRGARNRGLVEGRSGTDPELRPGGRGERSGSDPGPRLEKGGAGEDLLNLIRNRGLGKMRGKIYGPCFSSEFGSKMVWTFFDVCTCHPSFQPSHLSLHCDGPSTLMRVFRLKAQIASLRPTYSVWGIVKHLESIRRFKKGKTTSGAFPVDLKMRRK